jgi:hypothetical protein
MFTGIQCFLGVKNKQERKIIFISNPEVIKMETAHWLQ